MKNNGGISAAKEQEMQRLHLKTTAEEG